MSLSVCLDILRFQNVFTNNHLDEDTLIIMIIFKASGGLIMGGAKCNHDTLQSVPSLLLIDNVDCLVYLFRWFSGFLTSSHSESQKN